MAEKFMQTLIKKIIQKNFYFLIKNYQILSILVFNNNKKIKCDNFNQLEETMKKLATLVFLGSVAFGVDAQAFFGNSSDACCPRPSAVCDTCAPIAVPQRMERVCGPCGEMCCPKLGFWYNY